MKEREEIYEMLQEAIEKKNNGSICGILGL